MKHLKKNWKAYAGVLFSLIVVAILSFYFLYSLPKHNKELRDAQNRATEQEQQRIQDEEEEANNAKDAYFNCLDVAYETYTLDWNQNCSGQGLADECSLPLLLAESIEDDYKEHKEDCATAYEIVK